MAYVYHVSFDIPPEQAGELRIGSSLERVLAYLKALLPSYPGHIASRALYSLDVPGSTHIVFESMWDTWEDLETHRTSSLVENKIISEFHPRVPAEDLTAHVYAEVP